MGLQARCWTALLGLLVVAQQIMTYMVSATDRGLYEVYGRVSMAMSVAQSQKRALLDRAQETVLGGGGRAVMITADGGEAWIRKGMTHATTARQAKEMSQADADLVIERLRKRAADLAIGGESLPGMKRPGLKTRAAGQSKAGTGVGFLPDSEESGESDDEMEDTAEAAPLERTHSLVHPSEEQSRWEDIVQPDLLLLGDRVQVQYPDEFGQLLWHEGIIEGQEEGGSELWLVGKWNDGSANLIPIDFDDVDGQYDLAFRESEAN